MKNLRTALLLLFLCTACGTPNYHYVAYVGQQKNWTTSSGSYVKTVEGVPIYTQYPSRSYELVGAVVVDNDNALAKAVKYYHADAALVYRRGTDVTGSVVLAGPLWMGFPITETRISAQLIRFK